MNLHVGPHSHSSMTLFAQGRTKTVVLVLFDWCGLPVLSFFCRVIVESDQMIELSNFVKASCSSLVGEMCLKLRIRMVHSHQAMLVKACLSIMLKGNMLVTVRSEKF